MYDYGLFIGGKWIERERKIEVRNPYNDELVGYVTQAEEDDVDKAVDVAEEAFKTCNFPAYRRANILSKTADLMEEDLQEIARLITLESGKAIKYSIGEVKRGIETLRFAAVEALKLHGETIPMDASQSGEKHIGFYMRMPIGIIAAITPWNFPLNLVLHKVAPAIAAGNSVILKPATATPLTAAKLAEMMKKAGLPDGMFNVIYGSGSTIGKKLIKNEKLAMLTFTGSLQVGSYLKEETRAKRLTLELGSNSALIVDRSANIEKVVPKCIVGSFANAGQVCISIQRIYVHEDIFDEFLDSFKQAVSKVKVGNPIDEDTEYGPLIDDAACIRIEEWINEAVQEGAKIEAGGKFIGKKLLNPTVITNTKPEMRVICEELFAPVVCVIPFSDFDEAIDMANNSIYGLNAGVYTNDLQNAWKAALKLEAGGIIINDYPTFRVDQMPYGGVKSSGVGREGLSFATEEMTEIKFITFNLG
ncbi:MAG: aldehyde dehydrogenase family protein [Campylobacterota bacterium]|nr:aldehyde dehydrogenase family protein [Campylobacterota bacterium]